MPAFLRKGPVRAVGIILAIGLAVFLWEEVLQDQLLVKRWGVVEDGLFYRSGKPEPTPFARKLAKHHIKTVIDLSGGKKGEPRYDGCVDIMKESGVDHIRYELSGDGRGNPEHYVAVLKKIHQSVQDKEPIWVHCSAGSQRTGVSVALYRMLFQNRPRNEVIKELDRYDWNPDKNEHLVPYINKHLPFIVKELQESGLDVTPPSGPLAAQ